MSAKLSGMNERGIDAALEGGGTLSLPQYYCKNVKPTIKLQQQGEKTSDKSFSPTYQTPFFEKKVSEYPYHILFTIE